MCEGATDRTTVVEELPVRSEACSRVPDITDEPPVVLEADDMRLLDLTVAEPPLLNDVPEPLPAPSPMDLEDPARELTSPILPTFLATPLP